MPFPSQRFTILPHMSAGELLCRCAFLVLALNDSLRASQRLLQSVSPNHGRVLIYVWAIEQDDLSKRSVPLAETTSNDGPRGQDVFVPWAYSEPKSSQPEAKAGEPQVFNRYYHMFADGELPGLVHEAAGLLGLNVGEPQSDGDPGDCGVQIVQNGWERSNYYMELVRWSRPRLAAGASA
jgi:tRNA (uracil-5-)-methyltransferase TRM9